MINRFFLKVVFWGTIAGLVIVAGQKAEAHGSDEAQCTVWEAGRLAQEGIQSLESCAQTVSARGDVVRGRYQLGKWGPFTVAVEDGERVYARRARETFRYAGKLVQETAQPLEPTANDPDGDRVVGEADRCPAEAETINGVFDQDGCPDSIDHLLEFAATDLNGYWSTVTTDLGFTYRPPRSVQAYRDPTNRSLAFNAFYAPRGHFIAYDLDLMTSSLDRFGDFGPVVILAHEFAHLTQNNLGLEHEYTIASELQADCLAGAYTQYLADRGNLEEGDLDEGLYQMYAIGDSAGTPWFHPRAHGSGEQRYKAFLNGFEKGVDSCLDLF